MPPTDTPVVTPPPTVPVSRTLQWVVWSALGLVVAGILVSFVRQQWRGQERRSYTTLDRFNQVPPFTLTERTGQPFDSGSLAGKVWLADFFFTACPGPCLVMNGKMELLQQALARDHADVRLVSFSVAPEMDTPEVLRKYAARFHAPADRWFFLTGDQPKIYDLARHAFMLPTVDNQHNPERKSDEGDFIHSEKIALVDRHGVVRAYFDSTNPEVVQQVLTAVGNLLREEPDAPANASKAKETLKTGT